MSFPNYRQLDSMDCGPACLKNIAQFYGKSFPLDILREKCHITHNGVSLMGICDAASDIGLRTLGVKLTWEQLKKEANLPCIIHWNKKHFVVIYKISRKRNGQYTIYISDPAGGLLQYEEKTFLRFWTEARYSEGEEKYGIALFLYPTIDFYQDKEEMSEKRVSVHDMLLYLIPYKRYFLQIGFAMVASSLISLIFPYLTQSIVDSGISKGDLHIIVIILLAQLMLVFGQTVNNICSSWLMLHVTTRIGISIIADFLSKLLRLPVSFFDTKNIGDVLQRIGDYNRIQTFLTGTLLTTVVGAISFIIYSFVITQYDLTVLGVFLLGSLMYGSWVTLFMKKRRRLDYMRFQESASNQSNLVQMVQGMQDIKINNCGNRKLWEWQYIQAKLYKVNIGSLRLGQVQDIGGTLIEQSKNVLISFIAARAVIEGNMSLGMMLALQYIIGQLSAPIAQFISFIQSLQDAKISMERMNEIQRKEDEVPTESRKIIHIPDKGTLCLKDVVFQYDGPHSPKVLNHINLIIPPDKVTAIVGASGSGKTTLLKLLLGFYEPADGTIMLDNIILSNYNLNLWRDKCGIVMQEGFIFFDTIAGNIGLSDEAPDMERIKEAARTAHIHEFIQSLPLGYYTQIGANGHGLSSGQKQRILIARAIYKKAKYLFFDEATNSLDANNEKFIMEKLHQIFHNRTTVIVAHRLSTVKNADNIIVMNNGQIIESGTHENLIKAKGYYYELIKNQMELGN